ncbi:hypothetical protein DB032_22000 [Chromobacterium sp. Panama]|nr:hypothetical protein DB032_22000 [Chromobacterium sp. Panama]
MDLVAVAERAAYQRQRFTGFPVIESVAAASADDGGAAVRIFDNIAGLTHFYIVAGDFAGGFQYSAFLAHTPIQCNLMPSSHDCTSDYLKIMMIYLIVGAGNWLKD